MRTKVPEIKCHTCQHAIIIETGVDIADRRTVLFCDELGGAYGPAQPPREVIQCSRYENQMTSEGRGVSEMIANATLLQKDGNGNIIKLVRKEPHGVVWFGGHCWESATTNEEKK